MPYIGKQPLTGAYQLCDTITTSATATYNLLVGGSAVIPGSANNCIVSLNGVVQAPVGAFTVSGSQITFASTLSATDVIDFILILGNVFDIGTPTNGAVTNSSLNSNVITGQTAETTVAGGDSILIYDDSATALRKMTRTNFVSGLSNTPAFSANNLTSTVSASLNTAVKATFDNELFDTASAYDAPNSKFTVPSGQGGKYYFTVSFYSFESTANNNSTGWQVYFYKNGANELFLSNGGGTHVGNARMNMLSTTLDLSVGDYIEVYFRYNASSGNASYEIGHVYNRFSGFKIIE